MMLMRIDPFREMDRLTQQVFGTQGTLARPSVMPMDAWRDGDTFVVEFDLPGVAPDSIDLDVERNVVTVRAERPARELSGGCVVVYAYTQDVPIGADLYRRVIDKLGAEPLAGQLLHLCVRQPDGRLRYIDVWDSKESCTTAFEERIHPAVDAAFGGERPVGEPEVHRLDVLHASGALIEPTWS